MKTKIEKILYIIILAFLLVMAKSITVQAASVSLSSSTLEPVEGETVTVRASVTAGAWNLQFTGANKNETIYGYTNENANSSASKTITFTAGSAGTSYKFTLTGDMTDISASNSEAVNESITITVKTPVVKPEPETPTTPQEPEKPTTPTTPQQPQTPEKTKELEFKKVDETVYTTKSVNIRDSYSLSSNVKGTLEEGTSVKRIGFSTSSADGYKWSKIIYNGKTYYAVSSMLTTTEPKKTEKEPEKPVEQEEPTQEPEENKEVTTVEQGEGLKELTISGIELEPGFNTNVFEYTAKLTADVSTLQIETKATSENYKVVVAGNDNLVDGENLITVIVYDEKSNVVAMYQITVIKSAVDQDEIEGILANIKEKETMRKIALNSVLVLIIVLIVIYIAVYIKAVKTKKRQRVMQREEKVFEGNMNKEETFEDNFEENIISESVMEQNEEINKSFKTGEKKKGKHF